MTLALKIVGAITEVPREAWNALLDDASTPFVDWRWLEAMESSGCAAPRQGWKPQHLTLWRGSTLVAAAPAYVKDDSDGDFARDWDWGGAATRAGLPFYPKLCVTVPFTPATGRRFLVAPGEDRLSAIGKILDGTRDLGKQHGLGTAQVLFPLPSEKAELAELGLAIRTSFQYQWRNQGYRDPAEFLARLDSKRRNQQKRERAAPAKQGIAIHTVRGDELTRDPRRWAELAHELHRSTIDKLPWGRGWLNLKFYQRALATMPEHLELVTATREERVIAGAFNVSSTTRLYGRYWGCFEEHQFLHFNVCLYHSIDECIRRGIQVFEGGAGGEHKLVRGFEPTETWSAHWFRDARLAEALRRHLGAETEQLTASLARWREEAPILRKPAALSLGAKDGSE